MAEDPHFDPLYDISDDDRELRRYELVRNVPERRKALKEAEKVLATFDAEETGKAWTQSYNVH